MTPTFANPEWLWCLLLLPLVALLRIRSHWRARRGVLGLVSPKLTKDLVHGAKQWSRWIVFSIHLLALSLILAALARPQWGVEELEEESESRNVVIAIDTSRSMLANDLQPDRLTRAKLAAQDIVAALPDDRIALIAFAGKAFVQAPLTLDHDAVLETIDQFDTELIPRGGSNLTSAAGLAIELFEKVGSRESALIVFSDGEALEGRKELDSLFEKAKNVGLTVVSIGTGTENGSILPEPDENGRPQPGLFVKDDEGKVVRSRLDPESLRELSRTLGGGVYLDLGTTRSPAQAVSDALRQIKATQGVSQARSRPIDRFMWPLSMALGLLIAAWLLPGTTRLLERLFSSIRKPAKRPSAPAKSSVAVVVVLSFTIPSIPAGAGVGEVESPARDAYLRSEYDEAVKAYQAEIEAAESGKQRAWLNLGLGAAAYKAGDLALAKEAFGRTLSEGDTSLSERAHYNMANALFRDGQAKLEAAPNPKNPAIAKDDATKQDIANQWQSALEHYRAALALDPADPNAQHNLSVVEQRIQLLNQPPPPPDEPPPPPPQQQQNQQQQNQPQPPQPQDQPQQPKPQDQPQPPQPQQKPPDPSDSPESSPDQPPNGQPQPPQKPPPPTEPPKPDPEGKLEGKPDTDPPKNDQAQSPPTEVNPDTGFSPEEARQRLCTLADEDKDVRPPVKVPLQAEKYKNW